MELLITIGLDDDVARALAARVEARVVSYPAVPRALAVDGRVRIESAKVAGRILEPRGVVFYSYFDDPDVAVVRRALALSDVPTFPDVRRTIVLDDKAIALVAALGAGVPSLPRGYVPSGALEGIEGERVAKWGHRHCGDDKERVRAGSILPAPAIVEPFVVGSSERILIVGERVWHLTYESADWRKNVASTVTVRAEPDLALVALGRRIATHLGLVIAGIDFVVADEPYLLEVNAYPGLEDLPAAQEAFLELAASWWSGVVG